MKKIVKENGWKGGWSDEEEISKFNTFFNYVNERDILSSRKREFSGNSSL